MITPVQELGTIVIGTWSSFLVWSPQWYCNRYLFYYKHCCATFCKTDQIHKVWLRSQIWDKFVSQLCKKNWTIDTCRTSANLAWEALKNFGNSAYDEYWAKKIPPPIKCEKGCKCGPENYLTTFDWENETIIYEYNGSEVNGAQSSVTIDFENKTIIYEDNGSEVNGAQSSVPGFFALSITLFSSFFVIANFWIILLTNANYQNSKVNP